MMRRSGHSNKIHTYSLLTTWTWLKLVLYLIHDHFHDLTTISTLLYHFKVFFCFMDFYGNIMFYHIFIMNSHCFTIGVLCYYHCTAIFIKTRSLFYHHFIIILALFYHYSIIILIWIWLNQRNGVMRGNSFGHVHKPTQWGGGPRQPQPSKVNVTSGKSAGTQASMSLISLAGGW